MLVLSEGNETTHRHEWGLFTRLAESFRQSRLSSEDYVDDLEGNPLIVFCMGSECSLPPLHCNRGTPSLNTPLTC
jgi:hypothetical protein